jgi:hypothetical protein
MERAIYLPYPDCFELLHRRADCRVHFCWPRPEAAGYFGFGRGKGVKSRRVRWQHGGMRSRTACKGTVVTVVLYGWFIAGPGGDEARDCATTPSPREDQWAGTPSRTRRRAQQDHHRNNIRIMLFYGFDSSMGRPKPDGSRTAVRHCPSSLPAHPPPSTAAGDAAAPSPPCHAGCPAVAAGAAHDRGKPAGTPDVMPSCPGATGRLMDLT